MEDIYNCSYSLVLYPQGEHLRSLRSGETTEIGSPIVDLHYCLSNVTSSRDR